jgi:hypothetical protein
MKIWLEGCDPDDPYVSVFWQEPDWSKKYRQWEGPIWPNEIYVEDARRVFQLQVLPDVKKHELFELDLSGKPRVVCVWVPAK